MSDALPELPADLERRLRRVRSIGIITGAGISSESGIPTYRGRGGLYDDPEEGDRTVEALSAPMLARDPDRTWCAVADLARAARGAEPNRAHRAIAEIERHVDRFVLLTQNVDRLHHRAGSRNVIDIHGDVFATRCMSCGQEGELEPDELTSLTAAPRCDTCAGARRPAAVLFGEMLPVDKLERIRSEFYEEVPDAILIAGTSALFPYITEPVLICSQAGNLTIEINPERTLISETVEFRLRGKAGTLLPRIADVIRAVA